MFISFNPYSTLWRKYYYNPILQMKYQKHRDLSHLSGFTWFIRHVLRCTTRGSGVGACAVLPIAIPSCREGYPDVTQLTNSHLSCFAGTDAKRWNINIPQNWFSLVSIFLFTLDICARFIPKMQTKMKFWTLPIILFFPVSDCLLEIQSTYIESCPFTLLGIMYIKPQQITKGSYGC